MPTAPPRSDVGDPSEPRGQTAQIALRVDSVSKAFGGLHVLAGVSLVLHRGERVTVIGPNGAGKTTLFNVICGLVKPNSGRVAFFGKDVTARPFHERARLGLGRGFQISNLMPELTVLQNAELTAVRTERRDYQFYRLRRQGVAMQAARRLLMAWRFDDKRDVKVRNLSYGEQRRLDICLTLMMAPSILLLDEPTAGLSGTDAREIARIVLDLPRELSCLIVSHDLRFGFDVADRVVAMHQGRVVAEGAPDAIQGDALLRNIYF